jgi:uncharacterized membrane protein YfcA
MPPALALVALSAATAATGALGGLGGAIILVPVLVLLGVDPLVAAPLGMLSTAAGSLAAGPGQLRRGLVHHRLGVVLEITASAGAIAGALVADQLSATTLARVLAVVALATAVAAGRRRPVRNHPQAEFAHEDPGEWPGSLGGAYRAGSAGVVPYAASRVRAALAAMTGAGLLAGMAGVGGGFVKTPIMSELMRVPVKVAAATSTFTVGITAAVTLAVFAGQGRLDEEAGAAVVVGSVLGGIAGAAVQDRLPAARVRQALAVVLAVVGVVLLVRG